jgi:REP element-mobilizing transposase RayT
MAGSWRQACGMARLARVVVPGIAHHVTQRGNRRQQTFFGEEHYTVLVYSWRAETQGRREMMEDEESS